MTGTYRSCQGISFNEGLKKNTTTYVDYTVDVIDVQQNKSIFANGKLILGLTAVKYIMNATGAPSDPKPGDLLVLVDGTTHKIQFVTKLLDSGFALSIEGTFQATTSTTTTSSTTTSSTTSTTTV